MMTNHIGGVSTNPIESEFRDLPRFESTLLYAVQDFDPAGNVLHFEAGRTILFWTSLPRIILRLFLHMIYIYIYIYHIYNIYIYYKYI